MHTNITILINNELKLFGEIYQAVNDLLFVKKLPVHSKKVNLDGESLHFKIPLNAPLDKYIYTNVQAGYICYWPEENLSKGNIFFVWGDCKWSAEYGYDIPFKVNVLGKIIRNLELLNKIKLVKSIKICKSGFEDLEFITVPGQMIQLGDQFFGEGDFNKAMICFQKAWQKTYKNAEVVHKLAVCYEKTADLENAIKYYCEAICANKKSTQSTDLLADLVEKYKVTVKDSREANIAGYAYEILEKFDDAVQWYRKSLKIDPDNQSAKNNLVNTLLTWGKQLGDEKKYNEELNCYLEIISIQPDNSKAWYNSGCAYDDLNNDEEAIISYKEALRLNPDYDDALNNLAFVYRKQHNDIEADRLLSEYKNIKINLLQFIYKKIGKSGAGFCESEELKIISIENEEFGRKKVVFNYMFDYDTFSMYPKTEYWKGSIVLNLDLTIFQSEFVSDGSGIDRLNG